MPTPLENIKHNLLTVQNRIIEAAQRGGRNADEITLVAVTKAVGIPEISSLFELGISHFAENRIESAPDKIASVGHNPTWHMIGNLQRRKVRDAVQLFDTLDAVDRVSIAQQIQQRCQELDKDISILVEVNISGEEAKHGFAPNDLTAALDDIEKLDRIHVRGLMTMAPYNADESTLRRIFAELRNMGERHNLHTLSMGMSQDYEIAIEEGATEIRIGSALFE